MQWYEKLRKDLHDKIVKNSTKLWNPPIKKYKNINVNSCYDMKKINNPNIIQSRLKFNDIGSKFDKSVIKSTKIFLKPSLRQKNIIDLWFDASTEMYNETIKHIKSVLNFNKIIELRELYLKVNKSSGSLTIKNSELDKEVKKYMIEKNKLYKYISTDRQKTKQNIKTHNSKLNEYVEIRNKIKKLNVELSHYRTQLIKYTQIYKKIYGKINKILDYAQLRTYVLMDIRNNISEKYIYNNDSKTSIRIHILDCMMKTACTSFKTAITNYIEGNSGMFKIRYWSKNRSKKVMEIETQYINEEGNMCNPVFGEIPMYECKSNKWIDYKLLNIEKAIKLHYDSKANTYSLFVPREEETIESSAKENSFVGLDAGLRTFMTCISNEHAIQFGNKINNDISTILKRIDKNNNNNKLTEGIKSYRNKKLYKRIDNMVDEMHWKIINYLTNTYERIYIGILNMKDVVNNETSNISNMSKRVGLMMKHFQFRQRLIFKCKSKRISCIEVNERYTSKTCSVCGEYKKDLGSNKTYECNICDNLMDRDINASRCILLKNTI